MVHQPYFDGWPIVTFVCHPLGMVLNHHPTQPLKEEEEDEVHVECKWFYPGSINKYQLFDTIHQTICSNGLINN